MKDRTVESSLSPSEDGDSSTLVLASWHTLITPELAMAIQAMWRLFGFVDRVLLGKVMVKTFWRAEKLLVGKFSAG